MIPRLWEQLTAQALLGSQRGGLANLLAGVDGPLGERLRQATQGDEDRDFLAAVALTGLARRAGYRPGPAVGPPPEPVGDDSLRDPPAYLEASLQRIFQELRTEGGLILILPECLGILERGGYRLPATLVVGALELGQRDATRRDALRRVLGARGQALAAQNPVWSWALTPEFDLGLWETGSQEERSRLLALVREQDPSQARELVQATWKEDPPEARAAFLGVLEKGLSLADEPLLESALDDKRKEVRTQAAALLVTLPGSLLVARMTARLRPLLRFSAEKGLEVRLPEGADKAWQRDGVEPKPPARMGEKAWWLQQGLGMVPPEVWLESAEGATPDALVKAARASDFAGPLLEGWAQAAGRFKHEGFARALLLHWFMAEKPEPSRWGYDKLAPGLVASVPVTWLSAELEARFAKEKVYLGEGPVSALALALPGPLEVSLALALMGSVERVLSLHHRTVWAAVDVLTWGLVLKMPFEALEPAEALLARAQASFPGSVAIQLGKFVDILRFRKSLYP